MAQIITFTTFLIAALSMIMPMNVTGARSAIGSSSTTPSIVDGLNAQADPSDTDGADADDADDAATAATAGTTNTTGSAVAPMAASIAEIGVQGMMIVVLLLSH